MFRAIDCIKDEEYKYLWNTTGDDAQVFTTRTAQIKQQTKLGYRSSILLTNGQRTDFIPFDNSIVSGYRFV